MKITELKWNIAGRRYKDQYGDLWEIGKNNLCSVKDNSITIDDIHNMSRIVEMEFEEYKIDFSKIKKGTPLFVYDVGDDIKSFKKLRRYFSHYNDDDVKGIVVFPEGKTEWSSGDDYNYEYYFNGELID